MLENPDFIHPWQNQQKFNVPDLNLRGGISARSRSRFRHFGRSKSRWIQVIPIDMAEKFDQFFLKFENLSIGTKVISFQSWAGHFFLSRNLIFVPIPSSKIRVTLLYYPKKKNLPKKMDPRTKISVSDPNFFIGRSSVPGRNYPRLEWPLGFSVLGQSLPQGQSVLCNSFPPPTQWAILTPHFMMELCKNCPGYFFPLRERSKLPRIFLNPPPLGG